MSTRTKILKRLADGRFHSGTELGRAMGITRAAVSKSIQILSDSGLDIHRISGRGYRLATPVIPLEQKRILRYLTELGVALKDRLEIFESVDSTNNYLLGRASNLPSGHVCLTETQPEGRGRRGRFWVATPYSNLMLSLAWRFPAGPAMISGLSLAAGLAVTKALEDYGVTEVGLKWPNDVLWQGRKLAGLLVDAQGEAAGPSLVVLGVGINVRIEERDGARIDQPWVDLHTLVNSTVDRNRLAAFVIQRLFEACREFDARGFAPVRSDWERRHVYHGRAVRLLEGMHEVSGTVEGVDDSGALLLRDNQGARRVVYSGEISLRPAL